jgi:hypothetical protein
MQWLAPTPVDLIDLARRALKNGANQRLVDALLSMATDARAIANNTAHLSRREREVAESFGNFTAWRAGSTLEDLALASLLNAVDNTLGEAAEKHASAHVTNMTAASPARECP